MTWSLIELMNATESGPGMMHSKMKLLSASISACVPPLQPNCERAAPRAPCHASR